MASFLLEVGTEELPASFIVDALSQWPAAGLAHHYSLLVSFFDR